MRRMSPLLISLAACGGGPKSTAAPGDNTAPPAATPVETAGPTEPAPPDPEPVAEEPPPAPTPPYLVGDWKSACMPGAAKGTSTTLTFGFTETTWTLAVDAFADATCGKHTAVVHIAGPYQLGDPSATVAGAWDGHFEFASRDLVVDDRATANAMTKACRLAKVPRPHEAVDLAGGCPGLGLRPIAACGADHDVVALVGGTLQFGVRPADNDLCTPDRRPTALAAAPAMAPLLPPTGLPTCEAYLRKLTDMLACPKLPTTAKRSLVEARDALVGGIGQMADDQRATLASACQQGLDAMTMGLSTIGC